jgi:hypothetical protein
MKYIFRTLRTLLVLACVAPSSWVAAVPALKDADQPPLDEPGSTLQALMEKVEALGEQSRRIAELEAQNRAILEELSLLKAQMEKVRSSPQSEWTGFNPAVLDPASPKVEHPAFLGAVPEPQTTATAQDSPSLLKTEGGSEMSIYGFFRLDTIFDSNRADNAQFPTFILPKDPAGNQYNFALHPRLSRLGFNFRGALLDSLGGARIGGKLETDFQNGGKESRAIVRFRHAYLRLSWENSSLLMGQSWDIISPLYPTVNPDSMMWNAGNLGDRRPQVRYTYEPSSGFSLRAGAGLTGAVSPQDLDGGGGRDGEASGLPNFQSRIGYRSDRINLGFWGHFARERTDQPIAGKRDFDSYSSGFDYELRLSSVVGLKGEWWRGANLNDFRGGIGQGVNIVSGSEIDSRGGWIELGLRAARVYSFSAGFTIDDPENEDILDGGRTENRAWYITNQFRLADPFLFGLDYLHWRTTYKGLEKGIDNRVNLYVLYNF